jgi:diaminohydroxyphosphoribosylaminopyrimidine deaminase/5-amino-6-(5-phosphoribosylamino)uracil reductase
MTANTADPRRQVALREAGVEVIPTDRDAAGRLDLSPALGLLGERGVTRLLVEGGGRLAAALLRAGLIDRLVWMGAPVLIGGDGIPAIATLGLDGLADAPRFEHVATEAVGGDVVSHFRAP